MQQAVDAHQATSDADADAPLLPHGPLLLGDEGLRGRLEGADLRRGEHRSTRGAERRSRRLDEGRRRGHHGHLGSGHLHNDFGGRSLHDDGRLIHTDRGDRGRHLRGRIDGVRDVVTAEVMCVGHSEGLAVESDVVSARRTLLDDHPAEPVSEDPHLHDHVPLEREDLLRHSIHRVTVGAAQMGRLVVDEVVACVRSLRFGLVGEVGQLLPGGGSGRGGARQDRLAGLRDEADGAEHDEHAGSQKLAHGILQ